MRIFRTVVLLLLVGHSYAQETDSQKRLTSLESLSSTDKVEKLLDWASELDRSNSEKALTYQQMALEIAQDEQSDSLLCNIFLGMGNTLKLSGNYDSAQYYLRKSQNLCSLVQDSMALGSYHRLTGNINRIQGNLGTATENLFTAIRIFEAINANVELGKTYNDLALLYNGGINKDYNKALTYFSKAHALFLPLGDTNKLSVLYLNMAYAHYGLKNYDSAITYLNQDIAWNRKNQRTEMLIMDLNVLSNVYQRQGKDEKALQTSNDALQLAREFNNDPTTIKALILSAYLNLRLEKGKEAIQLSKEGLTLAEKSNSKKSKLTFYQYLDLGYDLLGDKENAYKYLKLSAYLKDSILNAEKNKQILELEKKYETEKKDSEIDLLKAKDALAEASLQRKKMEQIALIVLIFLSLIFFSYILYTQKIKNDLKQKLLETELQELRGKVKGLLENKPDALELTYETLNEKLNEPLSEREFEVLYLILQGLGNKQIAAQLFVTIHTVKFHLSNIYTKLGVSNRKEALQFVITVA